MRGYLDGGIDSEGETVVGFEKEDMMIKEELVDGKKQLKIISIEGMPGIGKTTLARKIYSDPLIAYHFHIRAWISVSREYMRRDLLLSLFSFITRHHDWIYVLSEEELADVVRKHLKGRRYLIVMDDLWDVRTWSDLKSSFPDDNNGNRIIFTSRISGIGLLAKPNTPVFPLRCLTVEESWYLFQLKLFHRDSFPHELVEIGKQIARKCWGLPLAIVLVAGVLANKGRSNDQWKQVLKSMSKTIVGDQLCKNTLAKLIWLWIAEGLIEKNDDKSFEDEAEQNLMDLIDRNLAIVSKRRSDGGIKACRIHDLLHEFCLKQVKEEHQLLISGHPYFSISRFFSKYFPRIRGRPCILSSCFQDSSLIPFVQTTHALMFLPHGYNALASPKFLLSRCFEHLKMLDILSIKFSRYPYEIEKLVLLSFLERVRLRHLRIMGPGSFTTKYRQDRIMLDSLHTFSWVDPTSFRSFMAPNLRKLGFRGQMLFSGFLSFPDIQYLDQLQKLKLCNTMDAPYGNEITKFGSIKFPPNLKSVTLDGTCLNWDEMSNLGKLLPKLEILKLLTDACRGSHWITSEGEFPQLKFLKFDSVDIGHWEASSDHFPQLQCLVFVHCWILEEIPSEIGHIATLRIIEVSRSNPSIATSAKKIKDEQDSMGNHYLPIIENHQIQMDAGIGDEGFSSEAIESSKPERFSGSIGSGLSYAGIGDHQGFPSWAIESSEPESFSGSIGSGLSSDAGIGDHRGFSSEAAQSAKPNSSSRSIRSGFTWT